MAYFLIILCKELPSLIDKLRKDICQVCSEHMIDAVDQLSFVDSKELPGRDILFRLH